ncbi:ribonuclease Z [Hydrotalea sp.]|uniref:ribonuclease Z n=1 Tax=Hydrotalea sp. TaxID=2881279 RepID=UPI002636C0F0|nr:ribonuclease Z [Hydrotalea sp.]
MFGVTILGNNSALPAYDRHPTAQVVTLNDQLLLIDCGEGTQTQLSKYKIRRSKINHILISHLHGDHYFGLPGLITSMGLLGREHDLHVYAPAALETILHLQLKAGNTDLPFALHFHALENFEDILIDEKKFSVQLFTTEHRVRCWGFIIKEKKMPRKINKEVVQQYAIPASYYESLQRGEAYTNKAGYTFKNEVLTIPNKAAKSYVYCADTRYVEKNTSICKQATLLYHETTYLQNCEHKAALRFHSTSIQAGTFAANAGAHKLIIGHFSSKYECLDEFLTETQTVFPNTELALEGVTFLV